MLTQNLTFLLQLADDADNYLPEDNPPEEELHQTLESHPPSNGAELRLRATSQEHTNRVTSINSDEVKLKDEATHSVV